MRHYKRRKKVSMIAKTILFLTILIFKTSHVPHNQAAAGGLPIILDGTNAHPFIHSNQATISLVRKQGCKKQRSNECIQYSPFRDVRTHILISQILRSIKDK